MQKIRLKKYLETEKILIEFCFTKACYTLMALLELSWLVGTMMSY